MRQGGWLGLALVLTTVAAAETPTAEPGQPAIKTVTYAELGRAIRDQKGKVVVVDFWFNACVPCKKEFPKLVALQNKYRDKGLVAITVNVDSASNEKLMGLVRKYLQDQKATTLNFNITRQEAEKAGVTQYPSVYIFDRDNHWVKRLLTEEVDYDVLAKDIEPLLNK
jgi:thiol-disulfide isomerase/thioredoxin